MSKSILWLTVAALFISLAGAPCLAEDWPDEEKILTIIVPHAAGGGTDSAIRPLITKMQEKFPCRIQIVNIGGAGSAKGTDEFLNMPNDGYAVLVAGTHTIGATMQGLTKGYKEMEQVCGLNWDPFIIASLKSRPYNTFAGMIEEAKKNPGKLSIGNAGMGGATGVASIALNIAFGDVFNVTPFNGGQNLRADVLGGRCDTGIFSQSEIIANLDVLNALAILQPQHSALPAFKDVPTLKECGFEELACPGGSFRSMAVRKGTPAAIKKILANAFEEAYNSAEYQKFIVDQGFISSFTKLDEAETYFDGLVKNYEPIVRASGLYKD